MPDYAQIIANLITDDSTILLYPNADLEYYNVLNSKFDLIIIVFYPYIRPTQTKKNFIKMIKDSNNYTLIESDLRYRLYKKSDNVQRQYVLCITEKYKYFFEQIRHNNIRIDCLINLKYSLKQQSHCNYINETLINYFKDILVNLEYYITNDINFNKLSPTIIENTDIENISYFLYHNNIPLNVINISSFRIIYNRKKEKITKQINAIDKPADDHLNQVGQTILHYAVVNRDEKTVEHYLRNGIHENVLNIDDVSPLVLSFTTSSDNVINLFYTSFDDSVVEKIELDLNSLFSKDITGKNENI